MLDRKMVILFNTPLNELDTEMQTYGCRQNNPTICGNNMLEDICALLERIVFVRNRYEHGRNNIKNYPKCNWIFKKQLVLKVQV